MNGISLAALLGAGTWFTRRLAAVQTEEAEPAAAEAGSPDLDPSSCRGRRDCDQYEFAWSDNALLQ